MSSARINRLRTFLHPDLDALPDRAVAEPASDSDTSGGVPLDLQLPSKQPPPKPEPSLTTHPTTNCQFVWLKDAASSYNPAPILTGPTTTPPTPAPLPATDLERGHLGAATYYSPIVALSKYPYKWCSKTHSQSIASAFFDQAKFWAREWDLYYLWDIDNHPKPLILVCKSQVQHLLHDINQHLTLDLSITPQQRQDALVSRFPPHPRCTPRYLGRSHSRQTYETMLENVPDHDFRPTGEPDCSPLDNRSLEAFKQLMEESFEAQKAKNKAAKAKKQQERLIKQKSLMDQFRRAQRYLGLRPTLPPGASATAQTSAIDPALPAPYAFDQSVVFVCVDVESYERAHHKITEVGISTLDTRDLANVAPGPDGDKWRALIRTRHFRIREHAHLVNSEFVQGCPDRFYFGDSTFVSLADAPIRVAACFAPPFGAHGPENMTHLMQNMNLNEQRNLIFLGHDTLGDVKYLQNLGFDPMKLDNLLEALDTAVMYRVWRREMNSTSLGKILHDFDIAGHGLHNAGNDAAYTVQAMLAVCVREATLRGPALDNMRSSVSAARLAAAVEEAQEKARNEAEGWSDHEADDDGGPPVPLVIAPPKLALPTTRLETPSNHGGGSRGGRGRGRGAPQAFRFSHDASAGRGRPPRGRPDGRTRGRVESSRGLGRGRASNQASETNAPAFQVRLNHN